MERFTVATLPYETLDASQPLEHFDAMGADVVFRGTAVNWDSLLDAQAGLTQIAPGAFQEALRAPVGNVKVLWSHDATLPLGNLTGAFESGRGLEVQGRLVRTATSEHFIALMKAGVVSGLSLGFDADPKSVSYRRNVAGEQVRHIGKVKWLAEVSLVLFPADPHAKIEEHFRRASRGVSSAIERSARLDAALRLASRYSLKPAAERLPELRPRHTLTCPTSEAAYAREAAIAKAEGRLLADGQILPRYQADLYLAGVLRRRQQLIAAGEQQRRLALERAERRLRWFDRTDLPGQRTIRRAWG